MEATTTKTFRPRGLGGLDGWIVGSHRRSGSLLQQLWSIVQTNHLSTVLFLRFSSGEGLLGKRIIDFVRAKKCVSTSWPDGAASSLRQNLRRAAQKVVPCCVFPSEFPERRNPDGTRLRTYQRLIDYLSQKALYVQERLLALACKNDRVAHRLVGSDVSCLLILADKCIASNGVLVFFFLTFLAD